MDWENLILVGIAFAFGGVLKGAAGAGAPLLAVPLLATLYDVPFAVAVFVLPNIIPNLWQVWRFRKAQLSRGFIARFALAGGFGAAAGTYALAAFSSEILTAGVAAILVAYIGFRLFNPGWRLPFAAADRLSVPVGAVSGVLQGATGLSAPVSMTFLTAIQLERSQFILVVSTFFVALGVSQLPFQVALGIMSWERLGLSALSLIPLFAAMPVGAVLGRRMSRRAFDRLLLCLLGALAARMLIGIVWM